MKTTKKQSGAALVEFALIVVLFFTILFAIIEFGYIFWGNLSMQHAVREGARYAVVTSPYSFPLPTPQDPTTQIEKRCNALKVATDQNSMGFYDKVSPVFTFKTIDAAGNVINIGSGCGAAQQIVVIDVDCSLQLITPFNQLIALLGSDIFANGNYHFSVSATMRNEAFK